MKVEISNGELLDKITILELKLNRIKDKEKLANIQKEFDTLNPFSLMLKQSIIPFWVVCD